MASVSMNPLCGFVASLLAFALVAGSETKNSTYYLWELGLPSEEHEVITEDGYILSMIRIPKPGAPPVLLVHGFMGTSDMWVIMERDSNLATVLADNGYDIWIANLRGNVNSHRHVSLSTAPNSFEYWDFSIDDIAKKDLPAIMNYITTQTGKEKMFYMGHSMGSTAFFILCSEDPELCNRLHSAVLLAPIAFPPERVRLQTVDMIVQWSGVLSDMLRSMRVYEFLGRNQPIITFFHGSCASEFSYICKAALELLFHFDKGNSLPRPIADYVASSFGGTSVKVFNHISSIISKDGNFGPYIRRNNGRIQNGKHSVNVYNLENITVPVGLISGADDIFVDEKAIKKLRPKLKKIMFDIVVPAPFKHLGYFYDVKTNYGMVAEILNHMKEFSFPTNSII